jgi:hypothetical protein
MRFRAKFGLVGWIFVSFACFYVHDWFFWRGQSTSAIISAFRVFAATAWASLALLEFLKSRFAYWDIDSDGLHQRRFGNKKEFTIPWDKVIAVRNRIPGMSWDGTVSVYYELPASKLGFNHIVAVPEHRKELIAALRKFAPQATFEV